MKKFVFLSFILLFTLDISAQNREEIHSGIRNAAGNRDYQTAINELQNFERTDKKLFALNNYDYLLARISEKSGDLATAMAHYQAVVNRNSILSEYALRHLAQIARVSGNLMLERIYLRELLTLAPDSLLNDAAAARMARSYFESRDFATTIRLLNQQKDELRIANYELREEASPKSKIQSPRSEDQNSKSDDRNPRVREKLAFLGQAYRQSGKPHEAREVFTKLTDDLPNPAQPDDFALAGAKGLDALDVNKENFGKTVLQSTDTEHFRRAFIYQFNRNFSQARLHFQAIVKHFPQSPNVPDALFQIGRGFVQEGNYNEAINWFERVQAEFPDSDIAKDALSQTASIYSRVNKPKEAVSRYQKFIEKYPNANNLERAYLNIVDVLRDKGEDFESLKWTAKTQEVFRGKLPEAISLFAQVRIRIAQNDWQNALDDLNNLQTFADLGGTRVPGGTNKAEIAFLKGFVLENLQRYGEAIDVYLSIPDGRAEYYGWRATERLKALANDKKTAAFIESKKAYFNVDIIKLTPEDERKIYQPLYRLTGDNRYLEILKESYAQLPNYKIPNFKLLEFGRKKILKDKSFVSTNHQILADELLYLGLYDEGTPELETSLMENGKRKIENTGNNKSNPKPEDFAYTLAVFYKRGEMANRAVAYAEPLWRNVPADYQIELVPREQIELLYPAPYVDSLLQFAPAKNVDARFILAIMRQESRFRADVKSNAAARGLLQFISTTAGKLAGELDRENFSQDELYNPPTAILFGSQHLSNLFKQFPRQPQAVAASYNGGEDNMTRWLARAKTDNPDRYVPEIAYAQSKDYVYKVMANYRIYQMLYDEKLKNK
ncbi:MAG TPA: transglycosylase SLT domain-containing protein [Pyrinomonadaceae bacterium]|nr:transglycosylase SLT domain-containing protein [Pyrinomonadaceae bacterium]